MLLLAIPAPNSVPLMSLYVDGEREALLAIYGHEEGVVECQGLSLTRVTALPYLTGDDGEEIFCQIKVSIVQGGREEDISIQISEVSQYLLCDDPWPILHPAVDVPGLQVKGLDDDHVSLLQSELDAEIDGMRGAPGLYCHLVESVRNRLTELNHPSERGGAARDTPPLRPR